MGTALVDDKTGFKRPPKVTQFKSGQSGNPKGRPKGSRNLKTDLNDLMKKRIVIREDGEARRISRQEAVLLSLFGKAARGDVRASTTLVNMVMKLNPETSDGSRPSDISDSDQDIIDDFLRRHSLSDRVGGNSE
jgi:hypothetical protein